MALHTMWSGASLAQRNAEVKKRRQGTAARRTLRMNLREVRQEGAHRSNLPAVPQSQRPGRWGELRGMGGDHGEAPQRAGPARRPQR